MRVWMGEQVYKGCKREGGGSTVTEGAGWAAAPGGRGHRADVSIECA
jgi:hypothetical protein